MNRVLAETLSVLNGLIAATIFLIGLAGGYRLSGGTLMGTLSGGFVGFLVAALACGSIAYLALIERHLARIADKNSATAFEAESLRHRREPTL